jgi:hypothetical protein
MAGDAEEPDESTLTRAEAGEAAPQTPASGSAQAAAAGDARPCMPCRGNGKVISNLGGARSEVSCPWCAGTGKRQIGIDAQARWRESAEAEGAASPAPPSDAA